MNPEDKVLKEESYYEDIRKGIHAGILYAHDNAVKKGFWENAGKTKLEKAGFLMLMVSELGEACEAQRQGIEKSDHIPEFTGEEEELADVIIRILDYAGAFNLRLADAIVAKMEYNAGRPYKHGKSF